MFSFRKDPVLFEILIKAGANINARNNKNLTPLHLAVLSDQTDFIKALIDKNDCELGGQVKKKLVVACKLLLTIGIRV